MAKSSGFTRGGPSARDLYEQVARGDRDTLRSEPTEPAPPGGRPWLPTEIRRAGIDPTGYLYLVVDDVYEDQATVIHSPWPTVHEGRVVFAYDDDRQGSVTASLDLLGEILARHRSQLADEIATRPIRVGDTYATTPANFESIAAGKAGTGEPLIDVTASARRLAKLAFYAAAAGTIDPDAAEDRELIAMLDTEALTGTEAPEAVEVPIESAQLQKLAAVQQSYMAEQNVVEQAPIEQLAISPDAPEKMQYLSRLVEEEEG